jgi:hypothetical protein
MVIALLIKAGGTKTDDGKAGPLKFFIEQLEL